jgi:hypothetical protein
VRCISDFKISQAERTALPARSEKPNKFQITAHTSSNVLDGTKDSNCLKIFGKGRKFCPAAPEAERPLLFLLIQLFLPVAAALTFI